MLRLLRRLFAISGIERAMCQRIVRTTRSGDSVSFEGAGRLFVDVTDVRGRFVVAHYGLTQPRLVWTWRYLAEHFQPNTVVDVGANYGEISLSARYSPDTAIFLIEANPRLIPFLQRSIPFHPSANQIRLLPILAADKHGIKDFHVDHTWSGTSSAAILPGPSDYKESADVVVTSMRVEGIPLDDVVLPAVEDRPGRSLIKVDVEGLEREVIRGLEKTIQDSTDFLLFAEYNPALPDIDADYGRALLSQLRGMGSVFVCPRWASSASEVRGTPSSAKLDLIVASPDAANLVRSLRLPFAARLWAD